MEIIGKQEVWSFAAKARKSSVMTCTEIRNATAHGVDSFIELATKIAELQFMNRDHVLIYRGQQSDYKNRNGATSLQPSMFRPEPAGRYGQDVLRHRFALLKRAEQSLVEEYSYHNFLGQQRLERQQIVRWSILQHYEVCPTPLLDVTHSLRVAASFASHAATGQAYLFVLGVPNLSGAITASAEAGIQIVRLSSVCPPAALRPHIQEGYLLGEYPEMTGYDQKRQYSHFEVDFGRRLIAKFQFNPATFWKGTTFPRVGKAALYPNKKDKLFDLASSIKGNLRLR